MTFSQKILKFDFSLAQGNFQGGGNTHSTTDLRAGVVIQKAGGASMSAASFAIYGLPQSVMNQLSTYGQTLTLVGKNTVTISAGGDESQLSQVFTGTIASCYLDGNAMPNVSLRGEAYTGLLDRVAPVPPTSMPGSVDATTMLSKLAQGMGVSFENNGVNAQIRNPYYYSGAAAQVRRICEDIRCEHIIDNGKLAVWPAGGSRNGETEISAETGLVAFPSFDSRGVVLRTEFKPTLDYGSKINVQSSVTPACGSWVIHKLEFELEAKTPNGKWFALIEAHRPDQQPVA